MTERPIEEATTLPDLVQAICDLLRFECDRVETLDDIVNFRNYVNMLIPEIEHKMEWEGWKYGENLPAE